MKLKNKDYKIIERKRVFDADKFRVDELRIKLPNGKTVKWTVRDGANLFVAIPITKSKNVIMTKE